MLWHEWRFAPFLDYDLGRLPYCAPDSLLEAVCINCFDRKDDGPYWKWPFGWDSFLHGVCSRKKNSCGYFSNFRGEPATISASYKKLLLGFVNFSLQKHLLELVENVSKGIRLFGKM
jgi:hypothetical protein